MSADGGGSQAPQDQEGDREVPGHQHPRREMLSESDETGPQGAAPELPRVKTEPEDPPTEGPSQEVGAPSARRWTLLSRGPREKPRLLPGGACPSPQAPPFSPEGRARDRQMATALLTAWSQMPVTFEDVALYLSQEEWGRLDHTQQSCYREALQKRKGLSLDAVEEGKKVLATTALGDVKPFRTTASRDPGGSPQCGQVASSSQGSGQTKEDTLSGPLEPEPPKITLPATSLPETQEGDIPRKPSEEEKPAEAPESGEDGLAPESGGSKKTYGCEQCGKGFSWHSHLVTHLRTHTGEKPYACTDCGKRSGRSSHLIQHQIVHTGEKPYTCPSCGKSFSHHSTLIQHQRIHSGEKPYVCDRCDKRFTRRSDLVTHQGTHTGAKPHKCPVCSKCFTQSSALVTHQRTHTGIKPYPCPECGKCFSQRSNLIAHNRTHTGEKPYHCLDCGKSFSHSSHLTAHQRTHRGVRPYACPLCGKSFSRRSNLLRHEKIHTTGPKALAMLMLGAAAGALAVPPPAPT